MGVARSTYVTVPQGAPSTSDSESPRGSPPVPDEVSPLLHSKYSKEPQRNTSGRWLAARLSTSAFIDNNAGLLLVAASQFFFTSMGIFVKWLNSLDEPVPTLELIWIRMLTTYTCSIAYMYWYGIPDPLLGPKGVRILLVLRGVAGFTAISGTYFSLQHLSLSDAMVLKYFVPFLTGLSAAIFLKEPFTVKEILAGLCSFFGVILIARPQFLFGGPQSDQPKIDTPAQRMVSVTAALIGVFAASYAYILIRAIGTRAHAIHCVTFYSSQSVLVSSIGMVIFRIRPVIPTRMGWVAILLICAFGFIAQVLLTKGLQREAAGRGTLALYTSVVYAVLLEFIIFHTTPPPLSIAGTAIIMSSAIYITLTKRKAVTKPVTEPAP
ncbi:hypothetical protein EDB86DRAFT_2976997 [Lactarius hatsudake]|nr:hypothetical protein EDB86DRAFT_2976997 [Lactarius hatsudake]